MMWQEANRFEVHAREIADRHYNRQRISPQFVPPGRCVVLYADTGSGRALWVTSWPFAEYVKHRWPGAWVCSAFRNEGAGVASELIAQALAATRYVFGEPPALGMVTFVDPKKVRPTMRRGMATWGYCYLRAGFEPDGTTKGGLLAFRLTPDRMPPASPPLGAAVDMFA